MNPIRPGYLTSEFWATIAMQVIAVVSLFYPDLGANVLGKWVQPFAIVAAALATLVYTHTRGKVKAAAAAPLAYAPVPDVPFASDQADPAPVKKAAKRVR